jgi:hypothetical protein
MKWGTGELLSCNGQRVHFPTQNLYQHQHVSIRAFSERSAIKHGPIISASGISQRRHSTKQIIRRKSTTGSESHNLGSAHHFSISISTSISDRRNSLETFSAFRALFVFWVFGRGTKRGQEPAITISEDHNIHFFHQKPGIRERLHFVFYLHNHFLSLPQKGSSFGIATWRFSWDFAFSTKRDDNLDTAPEAVSEGPVCLPSHWLGYFGPRQREKMDWHSIA